jgi:hypothetical protein
MLFNSLPRNFRSRPFSGYNPRFSTRAVNRLEKSQRSVRVDLV